jgi:iron complex outermembrane receptor protein
MFKRNKLSYAVLSALATGGISAPAVGQGVLEEVIVTATKRAQSMQEIPVAVTALKGEDLDQLRIQNFDDYIQYLPNVVMMGTGPGQSEIYIRGAATEQSKLTVSSIQGSAPSVALYQDEQPVSFGGRNLDVYAADMERVEVLPGPQGTLFGASSQAGTVRLITNKPVQQEFGAGVKVGLSSTRGGEMSNNVEAFINVPMSETLAIRVAAFTSKKAGWIDNVENDPANGGYSPSIEVINRNDISGAPVNPATPFAAADNSLLVEEDFNDATYTGGRIGIAYDVNDDWDILIQHTQQSLSTEGVFSYDPTLGNTSQALKFSADENDDDYGLTAWTINGRMGMLDMVYTGGYLDREQSTVVDYTGYTNGGGYQVYYMCSGARNWSGPAAGVAADGTCFDPVKRYTEEAKSTRQTHEFRISTTPEKRWRATAGVFYDKQKAESLGQFQYDGVSSTSDGAGGFIAGTGAFKSVLGQVGSIADGANYSGRQFEQATAFMNDFSRDTEQLAFFGEFQFDILPNVTATFGARWYDIDFELYGTTNSSFGCKSNSGNINADGSCDGFAFDNNVSTRLEALGDGSQAALDARFGTDGPAVGAAMADGTLATGGLNDDGVLNESDTIFRAALDWKVTDDIMLFTTYSEGFRPPVTNRNAANSSNNQTGVYAGYRVPAIAVTDSLKNYELGVKAELFNRSLRVNATGYYSEIKNLQTSRFDPANVAFLVFIENVGDAEILGVDVDFSWLATDNLTINGAFSVIDTEITRLNPQLQNISVPVGSELPFTPDFSGNIRARYDFEIPMMGGTPAYVSGGLTYTGSSKSGITGSANFHENTTNLVYGRGSGLKIAEEGGVFDGGSLQVPNARYVQEDYTLLNLAMGIDANKWGAELFVDNVTDKSAQVHIDTLQFTPKVVTNRPRTFGFRMSYKY